MPAPYPSAVPAIKLRSHLIMVRKKSRAVIVLPSHILSVKLAQLDNEHIDYSGGLLAYKDSEHGIQLTIEWLDNYIIVSNTSIYGEGVSIGFVVFVLCQGTVRLLSIFAHHEDAKQIEVFVISDIDGVD
jgi:hypothetical protein